MRYMKHFIGVLASVAALPAVALDFQPSLGIEQSQIKGFVQNGPDKLDLKSDLGLDKSTPINLGLKLGLGNHTFLLRYAPYSFSGDQTGSKTFTFADSTFTISDNLHTELKITEYTVDYRYKLLKTPIARISIGGGLSVFNSQVDINSTSGAAKASKSFVAPVPTLGLSAEANIPLIGLFAGANLTGVSAGSKNSYVDADAYAGWSPLPFSGVKVGYRHRQLKLDISDTVGDIKFNGPYAAVYAGF